MKLLRLLPPRSYRVFALAVAFGVISSLSGVGLMALLNTAMRTGVYGPSVLALSFIGLVVLVLVLRTVSQAMLIRLAENTSANLRRTLSRRILQSGVQSIEVLGAHRMIALMTQDVYDITEALIHIPLIITISLSLVLSLLYLGWLSIWAMVAMLIGAVVGGLSFQLVLRATGRVLRRARQQQDEMYRHFRAIMDGMKELKIHNPRRQAFFDQLVDPSIAVFQRSNITGKTLNSITWNWSDALMFLMIGTLFFILPTIEPMDVTTLSSAMFILFYLLAPLGYLIQIVPAFQRGNIALNRIETLIPAPESPDGAADGAAATWRSLELRDVTHTYHNEKLDTPFAMGPIQLSFQPGELAFLVGGNGSGKTTLAKILVGLYKPERGTILLDGQPVTEANREHYRQLFSVVFSDFYLFDRLLGMFSDALDDQAHAYLRLFQLDHKVQVRDGQLSTTELSQGQRKRLALLTAYLEDRPFYVFDEWAADQDPHFKELFYTQLLPELRARGKTVLVITHDDKYFHLADRIIKLDYGQVDYDTLTTNATVAPVLERQAHLPPAAHG